MFHLMSLVSLTYEYVINPAVPGMFTCGKELYDKHLPLRRESILHYIRAHAHTHIHTHWPIVIDKMWAEITVVFAMSD